MVNERVKYERPTSNGIRCALTPITSNLKISNANENKMHPMSGGGRFPKRSSSAQPPTSCLDKQWLHNLHNMKLLDRPKSVPPLSTTQTVYLQSCRQPTQPIDDDPPCEKYVRPKEPLSYKLRKKQLVQPHITCKSVKLTHPDLTDGQKRYLWDTARCYSVQQLKELTQNRMKSILDYEFMKRYVTKDVPEHVKVNLWKEYCDYRVQIARSVKTKPRCSSCSSSMRSKSRCSTSVLTSVPALSEGSESGVPEVIVTQGEEETRTNLDLDGNGSGNNELLELITEETEIRPNNSNEVVDNNANVHYGSANSSGMKENTEGGGEVPKKRERPKSAKYNRRALGSTNNIPTTKEDRDFSAD